MQFARYPDLFTCVLINYTELWIEKLMKMSAPGNTKLIEKGVNHSLSA